MSPSCVVACFGSSSVKSSSWTSVSSSPTAAMSNPNWDMSNSEMFFNSAARTSKSQPESSAVLLWARAYALRCSSVSSSSLRTGTVSIPISLAAIHLPWPSTIMSCQTPIGSLNPKSLIEAMIAFKSSLLCDLAFFS